MSKSMIAAGVAATAISFQAAAQCPDCEDLTCNWFACGSQTHTAQSTTKSYEVIESGSACPAGSPCRRRPGSIDTTGGDSGINLENSIVPSSN